MPDSFYYDKEQKVYIQNHREEECSRDPQYIWRVYQLNTDLNPGQVTHVKIENALDFEGPEPTTENQIFLAQADESIDVYLYKYVILLRSLVTYWLLGVFF